MGTSFTDLVGCELPLQLASMGGVGSPKLASAVTAAGGLGMIANPMSAEDARNALARARAASAGPVGVGFLVPFLIREAVEEAARIADVVEFFYGDPDEDLVHLGRSSGAKVGWQTGSRDEAARAVRAGCDYVVVQGIEAGGHIRGHQPLDDVLNETLRTLDAPVVAAGGIATAARVHEVMDQGAAGVRVGTRFLVAPESNAHPLYVDALLRAGASDTIVTGAFAADWPNAPHRVLRVALEQAERLDADIVARLGNWEIERFSSMPPHRDVQGHPLAMAAYAGKSVYAVTEVKPAVDIVHELMSDWLVARHSG